MVIRLTIPESNEVLPGESRVLGVLAEVLMSTVNGPNNSSSGLTRASK
jgi:hypothetical protein